MPLQKMHREKAVTPSQIVTTAQVGSALMRFLHFGKLTIIAIVNRLDIENH